MGNCLSDQNGTTANVRVPQNSKKNSTKNIAPPKPKQPVVLRPKLPALVTLPVSGQTRFTNEIKLEQGETMDVKIPKNLKEWTEFQWTKEPKYTIPEKITELTATEMRQRSFQEKLVWFRGHLQTRRVHWSTGKAEYLEVDRQNLLMSSNNQFEDINFYKQVKIVFAGQENTNDAGGLLREWMSCCMGEIFSTEMGVLKACETAGTFYKFNTFNECIEDLFMVAGRILGVVIGKAIFERIPLKCYLNYTILRQLCGQAVQMNDVFSYDRDFYSGWKYLLDHPVATSLMQNFCIYEYDEDGTELVVPLKDRGFETMVSSDNRQEYVFLLVEYYCVKSIKKCIESIKYGLYKIIPQELLTIFDPHELDMLMNGKQEINVLNLKQHTVYSGYGANDPIIRWFWEFAEAQEQEQLAHFLHFVTGNSRVPIQGFKYLESNRGEFQKFHIKQGDYDAENPYPKSYTCFNRFELPFYPDKETFDKYIIYAFVENKHFGLD